MFIALIVALLGNRKTETYKETGQKLNEESEDKNAEAVEQVENPEAEDEKEERHPLTSPAEIKITYSTVDNVKELGLISASSTWGIGLIGLISLLFCHLCGIECHDVNLKIERAKRKAESELVEEAKMFHANGIMNVHYELSGTTVLVYGVAYK